MKRFAVFLFFLLLAVFWFWKEAFFNFLFCFSDLNYYFYPYRAFMSEAIRSGHLPLWNPHLLMGYPFLATLQPGIFYPLSLLYYLLTFNAAFNWFLILHFPLGAYFMFLFCRSKKMSVAAAVGAGLTFGFSGYFTSVLHMPTTLAAVIWLPLVLLFSDQLIWLGLVLAAMFLGGEPTIIYGTAWILFCYLLYTKFGRWGEFAAALKTIVFAFLLAGAITAIQLFPFVELLLHSSRSRGITFREASYFSLHWKALIELVIPYFSHMTIFPWVSLDWAKFSYLGLIPLLIAFSGLLIGKEKSAWWLSGAALLVVIIMLGNQAPIPLYHWLFTYIPGFNLFRYPVKFIFILVFILAYLTGKGIDRLADQKKSSALLLWGSFILAFVLALIYWYLVTHTQAAFGLFQPLFGPELAQGFERYIKNITMPRAAANFGISALFVVAFSLLLFLSMARIISGRIFVWGLTALIVIDLTLANMGNNFSVPSQLYHNAVPENIRLLQADKAVFRVISSPDMIRRSHLEYSAEFMDYSDALLAMRNRLTANQGMLYGLSDVDGYESIRGADQEKVLGKIRQLNSLTGIRTLDMLNIKYLVTGWPFVQPSYSLVSRSRDAFKRGWIFLYRNSRCLPREYFVPKAMVIPDRNKALDYIFSRQFDPVKEVVLQDATTDLGGYWFASEWYYPGWKAYVDGRETKILRANYMFRAVSVTHRGQKVVFVYDPPSFKWGALVSFLAIFGVAVALLRKFRYTKIK